MSVYVMKTLAQNKRHAHLRSETCYLVCEKNLVSGATNNFSGGQRNLMPGLQGVNTCPLPLARLITNKLGTT